MVNGKRKAEEESKETIWNTRFFISNTFIGNAGLKLAKNQAKAKQNPAAELLLFENYSLSSFKLPSKNNRKYSKKYAKNQVCLFKWGYTINYNENEDAITQYLSNIWSSSHEKVEQHWGLEKTVVNKKSV